MQFCRKEAFTLGGNHQMPMTIRMEIIFKYFSWGVYGQLGHGNVEDVFQPKVVKFFEKKVILCLRGKIVK